MSHINPLMKPFAIEISHNRHVSSNTAAIHNASIAAFCSDEAEYFITPEERQVLALCAILATACKTVPDSTRVTDRIFDVLIDTIEDLQPQLKRLDTRRLRNTAWALHCNGVQI